MVSFLKSSRAVYKCFYLDVEMNKKLPTKCNKKEKLEGCA